MIFVMLGFFPIQFKGLQDLFRIETQTKNFVAVTLMIEQSIWDWSFFLLQFNPQGLLDPQGYSYLQSDPTPYQCSITFTFQVCFFSRLCTMKFKKLGMMLLKLAIVVSF